jgi:hypothetical protein
MELTRTVSSGGLWYSGCKILVFFRMDHHQIVSIYLSVYLSIYLSIYFLLLPLGAQDIRETLRFTSVP